MNFYKCSFAEQDVSRFEIVLTGKFEVAFLLVYFIWIVDCCHFGTSLFIKLWVAEVFQTFNIVSRLY